jgi:hypothetical protein
VPIRRKKKRSRTPPLNVIEGLPPKGAKIADARTIALAPKSGCGPCQWSNTGATLVNGRITSVTQAGYRTCWVYIPVLGPGGRVDYYKVSWSERCGGTRVVAW